MLIPLFVSCRENGNVETTTGADVATTSAAGDETTGFGSLPVDLDLGKAEVSMCLPFLKDKAESFSDCIVNNTPNGLIVLTE